MHDMEKCVEYLKHAQSAYFSETYAIARGLITAAVICYARPFSNNADHPSAFPNPSFRSKHLSASELELHNHLLALRDEVIAHSDAERNPVSANMYSDRGWVASSRLYDPLTEADRLPAFLALAEKAKGIFASGTMSAARKGAEESGVAP